MQRFRQVWPHVKILIRGDSGFCRWRLMRCCDHYGIGSLLGLARNPRLEALREPWMHEAAARWQQCRQPQRLFASRHYAAASWDRPRRVLAKAEYNAHGDNPRFVVTNLLGESSSLYDDVYCAPGEMENHSGS